jgi:hypothetical protein
MLFPAEDGDDAAVLQIFQHNFFDRIVHGYAQDDYVSDTLRTNMNLCADQAGLLWTAQEQMVVPNADNLRSECFESVHCHPYSRHYGVARTLSKAKQFYYWPNMEADIRKWIASCDSCQRVKAQGQKPVGKLLPLQIPGRR